MGWPQRRLGISHQPPTSDARKRSFPPVTETVEFWRILRCGEGPQRAQSYRCCMLRECPLPHQRLAWGNLFHPILRRPNFLQSCRRLFKAPPAHKFPRLRKRRRNPVAQSLRSAHGATLVLVASENVHSRADVFRTKFYLTSCSPIQIGRAALPSLK